MFLFMGVFAPKDYCKTPGHRNLSPFRSHAVDCRALERRWRLSNLMNIKVSVSPLFDGRNPGYASVNTPAIDNGTAWDFISFPRSCVGMHRVLCAT